MNMLNNGQGKGQNAFQEQDNELKKYIRILKKRKMVHYSYCPGHFCGLDAVCGGLRQQTDLPIGNAVAFRIF